MNEIIVKNLKIFAYHGVHEFEKINGQDFLIDIKTQIEDMKGYENDNIENMVSYSKIIKIAKETATEKSYNLIEKLANEIMKKLFMSFNEIISVDITIKKPNAPIKEIFDYVATRIIKKRDELKIE